MCGGGQEEGEGYLEVWCVCDSKGGGGGGMKGNVTADLKVYQLVQFC